MNKHIKNTFAVLFLAGAILTATLAFWDVQEWPSGGGLVNWPLLPVTAVLAFAGVALVDVRPRQKKVLYVYGSPSARAAHGETLDCVGKAYGIDRRTRKSFALPFCQVRIMESDERFRQRIERVTRAARRRYTPNQNTAEPFTGNLPRRPVPCVAARRRRRSSVHTRGRDLKPVRNVARNATTPNPSPVESTTSAKQRTEGTTMNDTIRRGDVYFCQGSPDAVGSEERKSRPVVIVQNNAGNASAPTVIVANMTTNTTRRLYPMQFDIALPGRAVSRVLCEQIRTVDKSRLMERVYSMNDDELRTLDNCLAVSFGITPRQAAQEAAQAPRTKQDDIFHNLTRKGLSVAVCPLPVLNQVNITVTNGKDICLTRNVGGNTGAIADEIKDMEKALGVTL